MKKLFFIVIIACGGILLKVNAQDISFGAKAGLNFSNFNGDVNVDGRTGFFMGGVADIKMDGFSIQPEIMYTSEGAKNISADYIKAFGIGKYYPVENFSLEAGPYLGFLIGGDEVITNNINSFDFGLSLGAGYEIEAFGMLLNLRYNLGLANISDTNQVDIKNGVFQLGVGYKFQ